MRGYTSSSLPSFSFTSILLRCTGPVIQRIIPDELCHYTQHTCSHAVPVLYRLRHCSITFSSTSLRWRSSSSCVITINTLIVQQNNIHQVSSDLPLSSPDSPCEGGTHPGSGAASSPVDLRCYKVVRGYTAAVARDRKLTEVLSAHWSSDGSAVVVTFDEVNCMVTSLHKTTACAWSIPVTIMSVTCHNIQRYLWQLLTLIIFGLSATHATNYLLPSASPRTPARTAH